MMNGQQKTYDGGTQITLTLNLLQWQQIMNLLQWVAQLPGFGGVLLINELARQINDAVQGLPTVEQRPSPPA